MDFLRLLIVDILTRLVDRNLSSRANQPRADGQTPTAVYFGRLSRIITLVIVVVMAPLMATVAVVTAGRAAEGMWSVTLLFGAVAIWLVWVGYDTFVRRIEWTDADVRFRKWNGARTLPWNDIVALQEKTHPVHIRIVFRDGTGFAISETMENSRYFMRMIERRLDPDDPAGGKRRRQRQRGKKR